MAFKMKSNLQKQCELLQRGYPKLQDFLGYNFLPWYEFKADKMSVEQDLQ